MANIAVILGLSLEAMSAMSLDELAGWHRRALDRASKG